MIERSPIASKPVALSLTKLQKTTSQSRFRIKSLRVKTVNNDLDDHVEDKLGLPILKKYAETIGMKAVSRKDKGKSAKSKPTLISMQSQMFSPKKTRINEAQSARIIQKNYQTELNSMNVPTPFLRQLFLLKCSTNGIQPSEYLYHSFLRSLYLKLHNSTSLILHSLHLDDEALSYFLDWWIKWDGRLKVLEVDASLCGGLSKDINSLMKIIGMDEMIVKIGLRNMGLNSDNFELIFKKLIERQRVFSLDIGNKTSQYINRFGLSQQLLSNFISKISSLSHFNLASLHLHDSGLQQILKGIQSNVRNPLQYLVLSDNGITHRVAKQIGILAKSGVQVLDLSKNPLGKEFGRQMGLWKGCTLRELDLSNTGLDSQALIEMLQNLEQAKYLSTLKLDNNDFSHNWFAKIAESLPNLPSLVSLSISSCNIHLLTPFFYGLTYHKHLAYVNLNNNACNPEQEDISKIKLCLKSNKQLKEIKMRFCTLKQSMVIGMLEALMENSALEALDLSENIIGEIAAKSILKLLDANPRITAFGVEKTQISERTRLLIQTRLGLNTQSRVKSTFLSLQHQSKTLKAKDVHTWEDAEDYEWEAKQLVNKSEVLKEKVGKLEAIIAERKDQLGEVNKKRKEQEKQMDIAYKNTMRTENQKQSKFQKQISSLHSKQESIKELRAIQQRLIATLEQKIKKQNQRIRIRQNELEDGLRNEKYIKQRNNSKTDLRFDATASKKKSIGR